MDVAQMVGFAMHDKIEMLRRIELALVHKDRDALYKANNTARKHIKSVKKKELINHWQRLIAEMEKILNSSVDDSK